MLIVKILDSFKGCKTIGYNSWLILPGPTEFVYIWYVKATVGHFGQLTYYPLDDALNLNTLKSFLSYGSKVAPFANQPVAGLCVKQFR